MKKWTALMLAALLALGGMAALGEEDSAAKTDVVVIGAGGAGMTAAIQAVMNGDSNVIIVEKMALAGGNTTRATGGLNAAGTALQKEKGIEDSVELMIADTMKGGKDVNDPELVKTLAENSAAAVDFVNEIGGDLTDIGIMGGASVERCHRPAGGAAVGPMLVSALTGKIDELGVPMLLETRATGIVTDETGKVTGVTCEDAQGEFTIACTAVVLATGGFGANSEMVEKYVPALKGFVTTNQPGATGDGIVMAEAIGAALTDIEQIQTHPTVHPTSTTMYTEAVRGNGAILLNKEGKRFVNELETRDVVSKAILGQTDGQCYLFFDQTVRESLKAIEGYIKAGIIVEGDSVEEIAGQLGMDAATLQSTLDAYNGYQTAGEDKDFARADMKVQLNTPKYYAGLCAPAIHHTMGGVKINPSCEVLKADGSAIAGLFAAGEVTGGVHGANRLGGNAVADIVVFGRIAGNSATGYVAENGGFTEPTYELAEETATEAEANYGYKDGSYEATGKGNGGDVPVKVIIEGGAIVSIELGEHSETPGIFEGALEGVSEQILRTQTADVDAVTGATNTSNAIIEAVGEILSQAGAEKAA